MSIVRLPARVISVRDLSPTAREVSLVLPEPLQFIPGAFVNVFMERSGTPERRAYTIASAKTPAAEFVLSIRRGREGGMSERFWEEDIVGRELSVMGPLGLNTVDKITASRVFLFGFGIGVSAIKALAEYYVEDEKVSEVFIGLQCRNEEEILYRDFFDTLPKNKFRIRYVLSRPHDHAYPQQGYLQEYVNDLDFTHAAVYLCGHKAACDVLKEQIETHAPTGTPFLIESFDV